MVGLDWRQGKVVRGGMTGYCRGGFRMDALMSVKLISLLSPKGLREGNPGVEAHVTCYSSVTKNISKRQMLKY